VLDDVHNMRDSVLMYESADLRVNMLRRRRKPKDATVKGDSNGNDNNTTGHDNTGSSSNSSSTTTTGNGPSDDREYVLLNRNLVPLVIETDRDIADAIDADQLRGDTFAELFLPVLQSLATSTTLTEADLRRWTNRSTDEKAERVVADALARNRWRAHDTIRCGYAIDYVRRRLGRPVTDVRPGDVRTGVDEADAKWAYPTAANGWVPLETGGALRRYIEKVTATDNRVAGTQNERRRLFRISGSMGVGKTDAILQYATNQLRQGHAVNVTYLAPRQILAQKTAMRPVHYSKARFDVRLYHHNSKDKLAWLGRRNGYDNNGDEHDVRTAVKRRDCRGSFVSACINSLQCTPEYNDIFIVDELAMSKGNMFMDWNRRKGGESGAAFDMANDLMLMEGLMARLRNSRLVFF